MGLFGKKKEEPVVEPVAPVEEAPVEEVAAPVEEAAPVVEEVVVEEAAIEEAPELTEKEKGVVYKVRMNYHAGYDQYKEWPGGGRTIHAGVGWFHPFGRSEYYAIVGDCPEKKDYPLEKYFTEDWMDVYDTALFCIYRMKDGDIYAYDGIFVQRGVGDEGVPNKTVQLRRDILTNVIVGGTGKYEGARGLMIGTAEGSGWSKVCNEETGQTLPQALLKCLEGYIRIPT